MTAIIMLLVMGTAHHRSHRCYRCHRCHHRRCTRCRCCWLPGLCMRLVLRLPPSSVVVCMLENPNQGGLVRTVLGHRRGGIVRTHWKGQTLGLVKAWKCCHVLVRPRVHCCLHGMQKNPSREGLVRTMSGHGRRVRTCWKGQTQDWSRHGNATKCWCALVHPRVHCCLLHGMQKNPSREGLVRTMSGNGRRVHTCWKGQTLGLVRTWKDTQWQLT